MKKVYILMIPILFSLLSYLFIGQLYIALLCLIVSMLDILFVILKRKKEQEQEEKKYIMDEALVDALLKEPETLKDTLEQFNLDSEYVEVDKEEVRRYFEERMQKPYQISYEEAKRKKKEKMFMAKMRILSWKTTKQRKEHNDKVEKDKKDIIKTLFCSVLFVIILRFILTPYFSYLKNEVYFQTILVLFLAIFWIGIHALMLLKKENYYENIDFNQWKK